MALEHGQNGPSLTIEQILEKMGWALQEMKRAGADVSDPVELETMQEILDFGPGSVQSKVTHQ